MKSRTILATALTIASLTPVAAAADSPTPCYITGKEPVSQTTVTWDVSTPRRITVSTQLGERQAWNNDCHPTTILWRDYYVNPTTYRLRPATTHVPVSGPIEGWPTF